VRGLLLAGLCALPGLFGAIAETLEQGPLDNARHQGELLRYLDPQSGAVLQTPARDGARSTCHILDSIWASAALDTLGLHDQAARALAVHLATVRIISGTDTPAGSLPRVIHPDGKAASFRGNADPESAAWLLAACWRHGAILSAPDRTAFLESIWPVISQVADYLAREPTVGGALSGAIPASSTPLDLLRTHYLGLESSHRMAEVLGKEEPGQWTERRGEIYSRIRFRTLNQTSDEDTMEPWVDWWVGLPGMHSDAGWDVLKSEAPSPTDATMAQWTQEGGDSAMSPVRQEALRCLMGLAAGAL
jgi:hypothetical protein